MDASAYLLDLLKYIVSGLLVFFVGWHFVRDYLSGIPDRRVYELQKASQSHTLPLRLQAYERLVLFLERINPSNMLIRLHVSGMTAREMHHLIIADIRNEFQHNISQQLYVSNAAWTIIKKIKEDSISLVNSAAQSLPDHASGVELSKAILNHLAALETDNPYDVALILVKKDIQQLF